MAAFSGFGWCCCDGESNCGHILAYETIGDGRVIVLADGNLAITCVEDGTGQPPVGDTDHDNSVFWSNVLASIRSGDIGCAGDPAEWVNVGGGAFVPTVEIDDATDLTTSIAAVLEGHHGSQLGVVFSDTTGIAAADYLTWISAGGTLILIGENSTATGASAVMSAFNTLLAGIGSEIRFAPTAVDATCQDNGFGWRACLNYDSPFVNGTIGDVVRDLRYSFTSTLCGGNVIARRFSLNCTLCEEDIGDGDYGVLIHDGTIGGFDVRLCLSYQGFDDTLLSDSWLGTDTFTLSCGDKELTIRVYCGKVADEDTERQWLAEYNNVTDAVIVKVPLSITVADPLAGTVSDSIDIGCGSEVVVADVSACDTPIVFPCCDLTVAELCCLDEIPPLVLDKTFSAGGTSIHVTAVMGWNGTDKFIGDINWDLQCDDLTPISDATWEDCEITCDGSGGFTLSYPGSGFGPWTTTADCGLPLDMEFEVFPPPVLCDTSTPNVFLPFEMLP